MVELQFPCAKQLRIMSSEIIVLRGQSVICQKNGHTCAIQRQTYVEMLHSILWSDPSISSEILAKLGNPWFVSRSENGTSNC